MSDPKLISPMLDDFDMGGPISDHDGVRCCPAMRKNSDDKYIVKVISVPASQTKLDALLLTGAYSSLESALAYFETVANGIADEKKILDNLAKLDGFVPFEDCQIVPMDDAAGYNVYLISAYRSTLEKRNSRAPMTQLAAVNLGLDICAALSSCRRSGYLYVDLKPSNIYVAGDDGYKIGDLGFVRLKSLKYESLPDNYRSSYTAPELEDAFAALNDTMDIYALGLILYQIFNGNALPFSGKNAPCEKFDAPAYADEEMAQIILKACDPDPAERWQDPAQMGQALVNYMQKNGVNDTPLTAEYFGTEEDLPEPTEDNSSEVPEPEVTDDILIEDESLDVAALVASIDDVIETESEILKEIQADEEEAIPEVAEEVLSVTEETQSEVLETAIEETTDEVKISEEAVAELSQSEEVRAEDTAESEEEEEYLNLSFLDDWEEESARILSDLGDNYDDLTDEVSEILGQIDSLAAHQVPDPVVAPEAIEIKVPDPIVLEDEESCIAEEADQPDADSENSESEDVAAQEETEAEIPEEELPYIPKKKRTGLIWSIVIVLLIALGIGGYFFYTQYYLQPIHTLNVIGVEDALQVSLTTDVDESMLTIVCADSHGNKISAPVVGGKAVFTGLTPDTAYTVNVEIDGFHKLTGNTTKVYSTPVQTKIAQINAITGSESGSVIISFAVDGPDAEQWNVIYSAEGEAERITAFPSHMVTLTGLTVGKEYTFRIEPIDSIYLTGETEITYVAKDLICAENLHVVSCANGELTAMWDTPDGAEVSEWTVHCFSENGYDETIITNENTITFSGVDDTVAYIVEVTAADMSVGQRVAIGANSVTFSNFQIDNSNSGILLLNWVANREIPASGWTIHYTVNGMSALEPVIATENSAQIPVIPGGNYVFTILDGDGNAVLGGPFVYTHPAATSFEAYNLTKDYITARLCKTPAAASWSYADVEDEDYVNSFSIGEKISMVLAHSGWTEASDDSVMITFAIYNEFDELMTFSHDQQTWKSMWYHSYCELDIPNAPAEVGTYNVILYINGGEVGSQKFEITT